MQTALRAVPATHAFASPRTRANSERVAVGLAGTDAQRVIDIDDEDLAVADLAGLGGGRDGLDHLVGAVRRDHDLDLDLGQEVHRVFGATVDLGVALLASEAL